MNKNFLNNKKIIYFLEQKLINQIFESSDTNNQAEVTSHKYNNTDDYVTEVNNNAEYFFQDTSPVGGNIEMNEIEIDNSNNESFDTFENSDEDIVEISEDEESDEDFTIDQTFSMSNLNETNQKQYEKLLNLYNKLRNSNIKIKKQLKASKYKVKRLQKKLSNTQSFPHYIKKIFNEDQIKLLAGEVKKVKQWSTKTVEDALAIKFACGKAGYLELKRRNFPLPSLSVLRERLQFLNFEPGILDEVFQFLEIKVRQFPFEFAKHCLLFLDEMSIVPGNFFDPSSKHYIGTATIPTATGEYKSATHILVFMLGGIGARWKQVVAYHFTSDSVNGRSLKPIIVDIIQRAEKIGLFVHGVTSDMGSMNQALWSEFQINASRFSEVRNSCEHPCDIVNRKLYFFHDVPHAFKNLKEGILNNQVVYLPNNFVQKNNLTKNTVQASHLSDLCKVNDALDFSLSLAPKLKTKMIERKGHFNKMKVGNTTNVMSHAVGAALHFYGEETQSNDFIATAIFISKMAKWFRLLTSRSLKLALSKHKPEKFNEAIDYLKEIMDLIQNMNVGIKKLWKPFQTGILISTKSAIELSTYLIDKIGFKYILTARFTQDCLENLFSLLRTKHVIPSALQVKNDLKIVTVAQFMKNVSNSSYDEDDRLFFSEFLDVMTEKKRNKDTSMKNKNINAENIVLDNKKKIVFNFLELNCLYYIGGYIINSIKEKQTVCNFCVNATGSRNSTDYPYASLTRHKCYEEETLFFINETMFKFIVSMEVIFRSFYETVWTLDIDLNKFFISKMQKIFFSLPECHKLREKIIKKYVSFRIKSMCGVNTTGVNPEFMQASKSIAMHLNTK